MKTNMTFLSWAGDRPWIVSSTPCTQAQVQHTAIAGQRKVSMRVEKEIGREKREGEGDEDKHEVRELGKGQALDSQQHSLHTSTGTATARQRKVSIQVEKESGREKREGEGDEDKHEVRELGRGQAMDSQQHSLHTSTGTAYSNSRAVESIYTSRDREWKREEGGG
jgi:hypothetical protein